LFGHSELIVISAKPRILSVLPLNLEGLVIVLCKGIGMTPSETTLQSNGRTDMDIRASTIYEKWVGLLRQETGPTK
jgi:hypothetical protein